MNQTELTDEQKEAVVIWNYVEGLEFKGIHSTVNQKEKKLLFKITKKHANNCKKSKHSLTQVHGEMFLDDLDKMIPKDLDIADFEDIKVATHLFSQNGSKDDELGQYNPIAGKKCDWYQEYMEKLMR